jgi:hypothetical protein
LRLTVKESFPDPQNNRTRTSWMWFSFITKLMHILIRSVCFQSVTRCARYNVNGLSLSVTQYRLIEKSRSCTIVNRVFWFVNDSVTSSCTIILRIRKWFLDGKPQLLLIKETINNYIFAQDRLFSINRYCVTDKLNPLTLYRAHLVTDWKQTDLIKICINFVMNENHIQEEKKENQMKVNT